MPRVSIIHIINLFEFLISESMTSKECCKAAKKTVRASLTWLVCGVVSFMIYYIILETVLKPWFYLLTVPVLLIYVIGVRLAKLLKCICDNSKKDVSEPLEKNYQKMNENLNCISPILRCLAIGLSCCIVIPVSIPMFVALMLISLVYFLAAGVLWCCGAKTPSLVELSEKPVYNQTISGA